MSDSPGDIMGALGWGGQFYVSSNPPTLPPALAGCGCDPTSSNNVGSGINPATGNNFQTETDVPAPGPGSHIAFERFYNSADPTNPTALGTGWRHSFSRQIVQPTFYASSAQNSSLYDDPGTACTSGWGEVSATSAQWANTTSSYSNGICTLSQNGTAVATLPVSTVVSPSTTLTGSALIGLSAVRDNGRSVTFTASGAPLQGNTMTLTQTSSGYQLVDEQDNVEQYNSSGQLTSVTSRSGLVQTMTYDSSHRLSTVTDNFGSTITLAYNSSNQLTSVTGPGSQQAQYTYDAQGRLATVTNPDSTTRWYTYDANVPNLLVTLSDENQHPYRMWNYDWRGRAAGSQEGNGIANATSVDYSSPGMPTVTDALGTARTFSFQFIGGEDKVSGISGAQCSTCSESAATTYDSNGFVSSRTDYNGNLTCYAHEATRGLELVRVEGIAAGGACPSDLANYVPATGTSERKISTAWSSAFRLPTLITEATRTTSFGYDAVGNLLTKTVKDTTVSPNVSRKWTYTYNSVGQVLTAKGPRTDVNSTTTYTYYTCTTGSQCGHIQTITDAVGNVWTYNSYNASGQPLTMTDPNGVQTTLTYDSRQRLTSRSIGGETTAFSYYPTGLLQTVTLPDSSTVTYTYDAAHRLTQMTDGLGDTIVYTLDSMGNRTAENTYDPSGALHRTHTRVFDTFGQLYQDVNAANTSDVTTNFGYDANGNQNWIGAPLSRNTTEIYDALNRVTQVTDPAYGITQLSYDANDNLTSVIDPLSLTTSYTYTGFGELKKQASPDTGTTSVTYDSGGNLAKITDARSTVATYSYDAANRATSIAYSKSGVADQTISLAYDAGAYGKGHLTGASDANHSLSWTYDSLGRVSSKSQTINGVTKSVGYTYTSGDLTTLVTPSGQAVTYAYNANHQVTGISVNGTTLLSNVTYEPLGPVNGWNWGNGTTVSRIFDQDGKISQISSAGVKTFSYDDAFRVTGITDSSAGATDWTYDYDALDRITSANTSAITRGWTYDANGNRLSETGSAPSTYTISATNNRITRITGALPRTYSYDAAGHTTAYSGVTATYNNAGRLKTVVHSSTTETLVYNALGQRIETSGGASGTILYWYDEQGFLLGEYSGSGTLIEETVWLGDIPVATLRPSGSTVAIYYVHTDHLNTPRQITRPTDNAQMWTWYSDPFGTNAANSSSLTYNLRFSGQVFDGQVGLHLNGFRDFDPATGRYVESDPIGLNGGSYSTYAYVNGNPISNFDADGLYLSSIHEWYTSQAAAMAGMDPAMAQQLAQYVVDADFLPGSQDIASAYKHGMCKPRQSMADCLAQYNNFINSELDKCSLRGLANAIHAMQDSHAGGHQFNTYLGLIGSVLLSPTHLLDDITPGRAENYVVPRETAETIKKWRSKCNSCTKAN